MQDWINPLNVELNAIRHLLALVGARYFVHVSRIRVNNSPAQRSELADTLMNLRTFLRSVL